MEVDRTKCRRIFDPFAMDARELTFSYATDMLLRIRSNRQMYKIMAPS